MHLVLLHYIRHHSKTAEMKMRLWEVSFQADNALHLHSPDDDTQPAGCYGLFWEDCYKSIRILIHESWPQIAKKTGIKCMLMSLHHTRMGVGVSGPINVPHFVEILFRFTFTSGQISHFQLTLWTGFTCSAIGGRPIALTAKILRPPTAE